MLRDIRMFNNEIKELPDNLFASHVVLEHINFHSNSTRILHSYCVMGLEFLSELILSHNHIEHLPTGVFSGLNSLLRIDLNHNCIRHIKAGVFRMMHNLEVIDLSHNPIEKIDPNSFAGLRD